MPFEGDTSNLGKGLGKRCVDEDQGVGVCVVSCHCLWCVSVLKCVFEVGVVARGSLGR